MDFSNTCSRVRRIMVDWEDRGLVNLLDIDHVMCIRDDGTHEIIDIKNCHNCPDMIIEEEEGVVEGEHQIWVRWPTTRRINFGESGNTEESS